MKHTAHEGFNLPEYADVIDIANLNENFEKIDATHQDIRTKLDGKADLVDGKVKAEQLPPIKMDQIVEQAEAPTSPDTILWVDTDEETPGVDIEGIRATADSAVTRLNGVDTQITTIDNNLTSTNSKVTTNTTNISNLTLRVNNLITQINSRQVVNYLNFQTTGATPPLIFLDGYYANGVATISGIIRTNSLISYGDTLCYFLIPSSAAAVSPTQSFTVIGLTGTGGRVESADSLGMEIKSSVSGDNIRFDIIANTDNFTTSTIAYFSTQVILTPKLYRVD